MTDPLAGQREAINRGETAVLYWPDDPTPPVKAGEMFALRTCHVEITLVHRVRKRGRLVWRGEFIRHHHPAKPYLLSRSGSTDDPRYAIRAQDEPEPGTLDELRGDPPEPEGVPPHEVDALPSSLRARQAHRAVLVEIERERRAEPLPARLDAVLRMARANHVDVSGELRVIERRIAAVENRVAV